MAAFSSAWKASLASVSLAARCTSCVIRARTCISSSSAACLIFSSACLIAASLFTCRFSSCTLSSLFLNRFTCLSAARIFLCDFRSTSCSRCCCANFSSSADLHAHRGTLLLVSQYLHATKIYFAASFSLRWFASCKSFTERFNVCTRTSCSWNRFIVVNAVCSCLRARLTSFLPAIFSLTAAIYFWEFASALQKTIKINFSN